MKKNNQLFRYFQEHSSKITFAFVLTLVSQGSDFVSNHFFSQIIDTISGSDFSSIWYFITMFVLLATISLFGNYVSEKLLLNTKVKIIGNLQKKSAKHLANASVASVKQIQPVILTECAREGESFVEGFYGIYKELFGVILGILAIVYTAIISWQMATISILFFIVFLIFQYFTVKKIVKSKQNLKNASENSKAFLLEFLKGYEDVKSQSLISGIKPIFLGLLEKETKANKTSKNIMLNTSLFSKILFLIYQTLFISLGIILVEKQLLTFGAFIALFLYKGYIYGIVGSVLNIIKHLTTVKVSEDRINSILLFQNVSKEKFGDTNLTKLEHGISLENVTVRYGATTVLNNISLNIPASGNFIGIVGEKGCGKSTLLKLCCHQIIPTSGSVKLDGIDLSELAEESFRKAVASASQIPFVFSLTIRENLLLARPNASDNQIWSCLEACAADNFVRQKGGLDVHLDQNNLSGGQLQCLALARLHLHGGKIILLDEATSSLDGESQKIVIETILKAVRMGHTVVMIAHRINTLKKADKIIVLDNGKIADCGTYEELIKRSEKFNRLASLS